MKSEATMKNPMLKFFILSFIIFLVLFGLTGAMLAIQAPAIVPTILQIVCAWSPTFAFLILFRKLFPGQTLKEFLKRQFQPKITLQQVLGIMDCSCSFSSVLQSQCRFHKKYHSSASGILLLPSYSLVS